MEQIDIEVLANAHQERVDAELENFKQELAKEASKSPTPDTDQLVKNSNGAWVIEEGEDIYPIVKAINICLAKLTSMPISKLVQLHFNHSLTQGMATWISIKIALKNCWNGRDKTADRLRYLADRPNSKDMKVFANSIWEILKIGAPVDYRFLWVSNFGGVMRLDLQYQEMCRALSSMGYSRIEPEYVLDCEDFVYENSQDQTTLRHLVDLKARASFTTTASGVLDLSKSQVIGVYVKYEYKGKTGVHLLDKGQLLQAVAKEDKGRKTYSVDTDKGKWTSIGTGLQITALRSFYRAKAKFDLDYEEYEAKVIGEERAKSEIVIDENLLGINP